MRIGESVYRRIRTRQPELFFNHRSEAEVNLEPETSNPAYAKKQASAGRQNQATSIQ